MTQQDKGNEESLKKLIQSRIRVNTHTSKNKRISVLSMHARLWKSNGSSQVHSKCYYMHAVAYVQKPVKSLQQQQCLNPKTYRYVNEGNL